MSTGGTFTTTLNGLQIYTKSSSCYEVVSAFSAAYTNWDAYACSSDPVVPGTVLTTKFITSQDVSSVTVLTISAFPEYSSAVFDGKLLSNRIDGLDTAFASNTSTLSALTAQVNASLNSPFNLSSAEGGLIGTLIVGVWVAAWAFKAAKRAMDMSPE